ncbi:hypothetical protein AKO1_002225, partial [Acrasis kona]
MSKGFDLAVSFDKAIIDNIPLYSLCCYQYKNLLDPISIPEIQKEIQKIYQTVNNLPVQTCIVFVSTALPKKLQNAIKHHNKEHVTRAALLKEGVHYLVGGPEDCVFSNSKSSDPSITVPKGVEVLILGEDGLKCLFGEQQLKTLREGKMNKLNMTSKNLLDMIVPKSYRSHPTKTKDNTSNSIQS